MPAKRKLRAPDGEVLAMSPGDRALVTSETVVEMERWAKHDQDHPRVRALAVEAALRSGEGRNPGKKFCELLEALIRGRVQYVQGPYNVQLLHEPGVLLALSPPSGNCVDMATLTAACMLSVGLNPRFLRLAFADHGDDPFEHVVCAVDVAGPDGREERCVLDSTEPQGQTAAMLARAVRGALHEPVGRPSVSALAAGEIAQEALTVYQEATSMGQPAPSRPSTTRRCPCGSSRLAGACCGVSDAGQDTTIVSELRQSLSGATDALSGRFAQVAAQADDVLARCETPTARQDARFKWIPGAREAAAQASIAAAAVEDYGDSLLVSPGALDQAAAYIAGQIGEVRSFVEWIGAATEALFVASNACDSGVPLSGALSWGWKNPLGRAGSLGAAALSTRMAESLIPISANEGPLVIAGKKGLRSTVEDILAAYDVNAICQHLPDELVTALTAIPLAGITKAKIVAACAGLTGQAGQPAPPGKGFPHGVFAFGQRLDVGDVSAVEAFLAAAVSGAYEPATLADLWFGLTAAGSTASQYVVGFLGAPGWFALEWTSPTSGRWRWRPTWLEHPTEWAAGGTYTVSQGSGGLAISAVGAAGVTEITWSASVRVDPTTRHIGLIGTMNWAGSGAAAGHAFSAPIASTSAVRNDPNAQPRTIVGGRALPGPGGDVPPPGQVPPPAVTAKKSGGGWWLAAAAGIAGIIASAKG